MAATLTAVSTRMALWGNVPMWELSPWGWGGGTSGVTQHNVGLSPWGVGWGNIKSNTTQCGSFPPGGWDGEHQE